MKFDKKFSGNIFIARGEGIFAEKIIVEGKHMIFVTSYTARK